MRKRTGVLARPWASQETNESIRQFIRKLFSMVPASGALPFSLRSRVDARFCEYVSKLEDQLESKELDGRSMPRGRREPTITGD